MIASFVPRIADKYLKTRHMLLTVNALNRSMAVDQDFLLEEVDLSALDLEIAVIQWDTETQTGLKFFGPEAVVDGYLKPEEEFTDPSPYSAYFDEVVNQYNAKNNPVIYYKTELDDTDPDVYVGQVGVFDTYPLPTTPPAGYTDILPPNAYLWGSDSTRYSVPEDPKLQWDGSTWRLLPFPYDSEVSVAKSKAISYLKEQVSKLINNQLRIYSLYDIIDGGKSLEPADSALHGYNTMQSYIDEIENSIQARLDGITNSSQTSDLFTLDYEVEDL